MNKFVKGGLCLGLALAGSVGMVGLVGCGDQNKGNQGKDVTLTVAQASSILNETFGYSVFSNSFSFSINQSNVRISYYSESNYYGTIFVEDNKFYHEEYDRSSPTFPFYRVWVMEKDQVEGLVDYYYNKDLESGEETYSVSMWQDYLGGSTPIHSYFIGLGFAGSMSGSDIQIQNAVQKKDGSYEISLSYLGNVYYSTYDNEEEGEEDSRKLITEVFYISNDKKITKRERSVEGSNGVFTCQLEYNVSYEIPALPSGFDGIEIEDNSSED